MKTTSFYAVELAYHVETDGENRTIWAREPEYIGFLEFLAAENADWRVAGERNEWVMVLLDSPTRATTISVETFLNEYIGKEVLGFWNEYEALSAPAPKYYACSAAQRVVQLTDEERATRTSTTIEVLPDAPFVVGSQVVQANPLRVGKIIRTEHRQTGFAYVVNFDGQSIFFTSDGIQLWNVRKGRVLYVTAEQ